VRLLLLLAIAAVTLGCGKLACDAPYSCPGGADAGAVFVDCMPPGDGKAECIGQCHAWLAENCPNVSFVY
jgi:hypothetical protein